MNFDKSTFPNKTLAGSSMVFMTESLTELVVHLDNALGALALSCPHGRDYIGRDESYRAAQEQHKANYNELLKLKNFYEDKRDHCHDQSL